MFKIMIQLGLSSMVFLFSALVAWYEGSNILQNVQEWESTAIFTQQLNGAVTQSNDILLVDYFIYAAKFFPTFPILMLLSGTHLLIIIGYLLFKRSQKGYAGFLSLIGILYLGISGIVANFPTNDLQTFFNLFFLLGILLTVAALAKALRSNRKKEQIPSM
ncbi:YjdJ family protein [Niallia sp. Krafla_26]|uniref:YjdJ family protein n=1 Tax=Niallia sp. Krafla_26 TaxID=3064703 RepID=UPI003D1689D3